MTMPPRKHSNGRAGTAKIAQVGLALPDLAALHPALPQVLTRLAKAPGGRRKLEHSLRVMANIRGRTARLVAALHDVIETTDLTLKDLQRMNFPSSVVHGVDLLTRRPRERYFAYIRRLMNNPLARSVKLADLADNAVRLREHAPQSLHARRKLCRNRAARRLLRNAKPSSPRPPDIVRPVRTTRSPLTGGVGDARAPLRSAHRTG